MSLIPFLALYFAVVFVPLYAAVRDLMIHQIRIERTRAVLALATRDGAQMAVVGPDGMLRGVQEKMKQRVFEVWNDARIRGANLDQVACAPTPVPRCTAMATVVTRGFLGTLRTTVRGGGTVLHGITQAGQ